MMMEKHRMMSKQMTMFKQKQAMMARQREMMSQQARGGGKRCPDKLERFKRCRLPSCPLDECDSASWAPWGPCSATCDSSGVQTRARLSSPGCEVSGREERVCLLPCCHTVAGECVDTP